MELDFSVLSKYTNYFIEGTKFTIIIALITVLIGTIIGMFLSIMKLSKYKILRIISSIYIECFRGTPILVQLYLVYFAIPVTVGIKFDPMTAGIITLSLNSGAYVAEIIRAGILAVDKGQKEAARSLGMSESKAMYLVVLPQAIKNILPALANEFITIIKESSIASIIGVNEIMYNTDTIRGNTFKAFEPLIVAAAIYFVLTFSLSKLVAYFERRMGDSDSH
ncbi:amino acid ABC transporter permease [Clostridium mediterraneense]|uniref:amino acid ABC transporter permease n=1 Tax=Clostridium mediterraneense TaxID=1805472 RepID=UPI000833CB47|nr:amino acid ABC transporter permease [Clostridium mediterraneense]